VNEEGLTVMSKKEKREEEEEIRSIFMVS